MTITVNRIGDGNGAFRPTKMTPETGAFRPDLPSDVRWSVLFSSHGRMTVRISDTDAERADVQAAIDRAKTS